MGKRKISPAMKNYRVNRAIVEIYGADSRDLFSSSKSTQTSESESLFRIINRSYMQRVILALTRSSVKKHQRSELEDTIKRVLLSR